MGGNLSKSREQQCIGIELWIVLAFPRKFNAAKYYGVLEGVVSKHFYPALDDGRMEVMKCENFLFCTLGIPDASTYFPS